MQTHGIEPVYCTLRKTEQEKNTNKFRVIFTVEYCKQLRFIS